MGFIEAILLGLVEGLTEFLPVSSTGHLVLTGHFLGIQERADVKAFEVVVQTGAIFAVVWHYRQGLWERLRRVFSRDPLAWRVFAVLGVAFVPAAVTGLLFAKAIKAHLFGPRPVVWALIVGGVAMIVVERLLRRRPATHEVPGAGGFETLEGIPFAKAFGVGCIQCLALWPGVSRSMSTILGGRVLGLSAAQATEFSFLLAIPTLLAAGAYDFLKPEAREAFLQGGGTWLSGLLMSFVSALLVIRVFLHFVKRYPLEIFGWYRIAIGAILLFFLA